MKVIILGSGPAGLMAAQAVVDAHTGNGRQNSLRMAIISRKQMSPLYGAQYLHQPIPRTTPADSEVTIQYRLDGDVDDYRRKVYGMQWSGTVSPEDLHEEHLGWDIRATYRNLWSRWASEITDGEVDPISFLRLLENDQPDLVISTIPRVALCHNEHSFGAMEVWAAGDAPDLGIRIPYRCPENTVVCNGEDSPSWYRMSRVFGHTTVEWPGNIHRVPIDTAARVKKPTRHDCDCWNDMPVMFAGRYGRWEKGVLSHTAYYDTVQRVDERLGGRVAAAEASA